MTDISGKILGEMCRVCGLYDGSDCNPEALRELLFDKNLELSHKPVGSKFVDMIVFYARLSKNEEIVRHVANFIKLRAKNNLTKQLLAALLEGHVELVESLLKRGASVKLWWNIMFPPAICNSVFIARASRKELLMLLIKYGLDVGFRSRDDYDILGAFCMYVDKNDNNAAEVAEILLAFGVSIERTYDYGLRSRTSFELSIDRQNISLVSFFIKNGANLNSQEKEYWNTPLHSAVRCKNEEIVDLLLSNGAEINALNRDGCTPLSLACSLNVKEVISLLVWKGASLKSKDSYNRTPLQNLNPKLVYYDECLSVMVKEFAKLFFEKMHREFHAHDINFIQKNPRTRELFENCLCELNQMSGKKFYGTFSYYTLLKMKSVDMKKLSNLTKNEEVVEEFQGSICQFFHYQNDLERIIKLAMDIRDRSEVVVSRLFYTFGKYLIEDIVKILAEYLTPEDLPLE